MDSLPQVKIPAPETFEVHSSHAGVYPKLTPKPQPHVKPMPYMKLHSTGKPTPGTKLIPGMQLPILASKHKVAPEYRG